MRIPKNTFNDIKGALEGLIDLNQKYVIKLKQLEHRIEKLEPKKKEVGNSGFLMLNPTEFKVAALDLLTRIGIGLN